MLKIRDKDLIERYTQLHEDMSLEIGEIALEYAIQRKREDLVSRSDSSVYYGRITRAGPFLYPEGWKVKDYKNLKPLFQKTDHLPLFGSRSYGSHAEEKEGTHLVGFSTDWEYDDLNEEIFGYSYFFDDVGNLSDLKNPVELPVSIKFDDVGQGNQQKLTGLHHLAVSLNKLEDDRCGLEGGKACTISPVGDYEKPMEQTKSTITDGVSDSNELHTAVADTTDYSKLNNSEISEAIDMTDKKKTSPGAGKPTPNKNEIGTEIEKCADGDLTEPECKAKQKREERTGKWDGEVGGKMSKDLADMNITLEDLTNLLDENDALKEELDQHKQVSSDLESKVNKLIRWQEKALKEEDNRLAGELEVIKKDLVDNHNICDKFIENHDTYDFLSEFHKGLPHEETVDTADEDGIIPTSLADLGKKLETVKEGFDYLKM